MSNPTKKSKFKKPIKYENLKGDYAIVAAEFVKFGFSKEASAALINNYTREEIYSLVQNIKKNSHLEAKKNADKLNVLETENIRIKKINFELNVQISSLEKKNKDLDERLSMLHSFSKGEANKLVNLLREVAMRTKIVHPENDFDALAAKQGMNNYCVKEIIHHCNLGNPLSFNWENKPLVSNG